MLIGQYIVFVDSDDYIEKEMILHLKNNIEDKDLSVCAYQRVFLDGITEKCTVKLDIVLNKEQFKKAMFYNGKYKFHYQGITHSKMFRKEIIKDSKIRFNEQIKYNEDRLFVYEYLNNCTQDVYLSKYMGYNYFQRDNSTTGQKEYKNEMYTEFIAFDIMSEIARSNKEHKINDIIRAEFVIRLLDMYATHYKNSGIKKYLEEAQKYTKQIMISLNVKLKVKLQIIKRYLKIAFIK